MKPKSLLGLGIVTAVVVVATVVSVAKRYTETHALQDQGPVVSGLEDKLNSVAEFSVRSSEGTFTIHRKGGIWTMADKGDYPVNEEAVRTMLFQLSQLRLAEAKTRMPERYSRIDVQDVDAKDAKSALLTVKDDKDGVLAKLLIGKLKPSTAGAAESGVYLRKPGDPQSWLARGAFEMSRTAPVWLVKKIVDIDKERIESVTTIQPDGKKLVVSRQKADAAFTIRGLPQGKQVKKGGLDGFDTALSGLDLGDVMLAEKKPLPADKSIRVEVTTFDGLVIDGVVEKADTGVYVRFKASALPGGEAAKADAKGKIDVAKEAQEINARVGRWVYMVPEYKVSAFLKKRKDLIGS